MKKTVKKKNNNNNNNYTMKDGIVIGYVERDDFRNFFKNFIKEQMLLFNDVENLVDYLLSREGGPIYNIEDYNDDMPEYKNLFCYILDARLVDDDFTYTIAIDIAFSSRCIKTFLADIDSPFDKMSEELNEIIGDTHDLKSIKYKPFFIRLGKPNIANKYGEVLKFRRLNEKCFCYLNEIIDWIFNYEMD